MSEASTDLIVIYLPWLLSAITIWMTVLAGNKHPSAWLIGLVGQALWLGWIVASSNWGLLPMNLALWIVYGRNHLKWNEPAPPAICAHDWAPITFGSDQCRKCQALRTGSYLTDDEPVQHQRPDDAFGKHWAV